VNSKNTDEIVVGSTGRTELRNRVNYGVRTNRAKGCR
jgi:hypothetical protein